MLAGIEGEKTMPTFETPQPISVTVNLGVASAWIIASDRTDTVVDIRPSNESKASSVKVAEMTSVDYSNGRLQILTPKTWKRLVRSGASVDVTIQLPSGSEVDGKLGTGEFQCKGHLGECRLTTEMGSIRVEEAATAKLDTGMGNIMVARTLGDVDVSTGTGTLRVDAVGGSATARNLNGDTELGDVSGDLRVKSANGDIDVDRARASANAKTASGTVRIGAVASGSIVLESTIGGVDVGIQEGSAAQLDLKSQYGTVHNSLESQVGPDESHESVMVRARTLHGDIVVRRAPADTSS